jgi:hypothetical protein
MKRYTWKEIAEASEAEKKLIVETYGLLGAVAIELANSVTGAADPDSVESCAVYKFLKDDSCESCPLKKVACDYSGGETQGRWIKWYAELHKASRKKK